MENENQITLHLKNTKPVKLLELAEAFSSIADEYENTEFDSQLLPATIKPELFVTKVREGSIIADLQVCAIGAIDFAIKYGPQIYAFIKDLKGICDFYAGKTSQKPDISSRTLQNVQKICAPIANDSGSVFLISGNNNTVNITLDSKSAQTISKNITTELSSKQSSFSIENEVRLSWYQTKKDFRSKTGDRAIITSLHPKPLRTTFANSYIKESIFHEDLYQKEYIADVLVERIETGEAVSYQILKIHAL